MDKYGLIGFPLKHSFSNRYFTDKFAKEKIQAAHTNYEIDNIDTLKQILASEAQLKGLNVTIPYKEQVIPYLDELDRTAKSIGAVNVIKVNKEDDKTRLIGYNSDLIGFRESIRPLIIPDIHQKALILGTGGASKAVFHGLQDLNIEVKYVSRNAREGVLTYKDLTKAVIDKFTVIVNASPLGTFPNVEEYPNIPYHLLDSRHLLYDLVYNPPLTKFLELGAKQGATIKNGAEMFELQALASWKIWNDLED